MSDQKYAQGYPVNQGYYQGPPAVAPPQYAAAAAPPSKNKLGFLQGCLAGLCCCCCIDGCCCCDPSSVCFT